MGQQQLLLVILVTIIVGIATVVAINTFGAAADSANLDAVVIDVSQIAAASQGYYMKPTMLGGGSRSFAGLTFNDFAFPAAGITTGADVAQNENGFYEIEEIDASSFKLIACAASNEGYVAGAIAFDEATGVSTLTKGTCGTPVREATIRANSYDPLEVAGS